MRYSLIVPLLVIGAATPAPAQLSIGLNIGLNVSSYPDMEPIPGYPAYYAPGMNSNFFFYDGMYWVYQGDAWYSSEWYNGPWSPVDAFGVPLFVLRIPVRYYRQPPAMFMGWQGDAAPRWGERYGRDWEHRRSGWDHWDRRSVPAPARLPTYQRNYSGARYPRVEQQRALNTRNYQYQPRDPVVRQQIQQHRAQAAPQGRPDPHGDQGRNQHPVPAPQNHERPIPNQQPQPRPMPTQQRPAPGQRPQERPAERQQPDQHPQHPQERPAERQQPAQRPQERPADRQQPGQRPQERPADRQQPGQRSQERPAERQPPAQHPQERPAERQQPAQRPQERPAERQQPAQRPQERPAERQQPAQQHEQPNHGQGHGKGEERHEERK